MQALREDHKNMPNIVHVKKDTDIIVILDQSGSMYGLHDDVIGGFNSFLEDQQKLEGDAYLTLVLFSGPDKIIVVHDRKPIQDVPKLDSTTYSPDGSTALYDAIGRTLVNANDAERAIVMIYTDGYENDSREYKRHHIKQMIEDKSDWQFHFYGANIDAMSAGRDIGIQFTQTVSHDSKGMQQTYNNMSLSTRAYRSQ
jgi:uncharacterized protein YegL